MNKSDLETASLGGEVEARRQRGAGGKVRKPPSRRPSTTPYARSQQNQAQRSSRWFSRLLVDPACRLISGSANLVLPYLFWKPQSADDSITMGGAREEEGEDHQLPKVEGDPYAGDNDDGNVAFNQHAVSRSTEVAGTSKGADGLKNDGHQHLKKADGSGHYNLSEIEQLMKYTTFSRDEIIHLTKILRSRAIDLPNVGQEKKGSSVIADSRGLDARSASALEYSGKPTEEKKEDFSGTLGGISEIPNKKYLGMIGGDVGVPAISFEKSKRPTEENHEELNAATLGTSTPLLSTLKDDVGSSPIEIAKAYMKNQTLEAGFCSLGSNSKDQEIFSQGKAFPSKPLIPSPLPKTSTCWPGAMTQDRGYMTPQTQRGRFGFNSFPRTPYSRTILKSKPKLLGDGNKHLNITSTPHQPSLTPRSGQVASKGTMLYDSHGSVGPIRRSRQRVLEATTRGSAYVRSSSKNSQVENFDVSEGSFSTAKKNFQDGGKNSSSKFLSADSKLLNSEVSAPSFPDYSRQMTRKILDLLERNPVTPKDKSAELKLAISGNLAQSSEVTSLAFSGAFNSLSKSDQDGSNNSLRLSEDRGNSLFKFPPEVPKDPAKNCPSASDVKVNCSTVLTSGSDVRPSKYLKQSLDSQVRSAQEVVPGVTGSAVPSLEKKLQSHSSATKPVLPSISIDKPGQSWRFSSDKSSGFTFPVSSSFGVSSEPPTPSIMPLSSASGLQSSKEASSIPSYSFGKTRSTPALVFSFPSTSNAPPAQDDALDLNFNFGSDKTTRISFSSLGKDAVCY